MAKYEMMVVNELIENPLPRCACMVVLDVSGSMAGEAIEQLNNGMQRFISAVQEDEVAACSVEVGVVTAGSRVDVALPLTTAMNIQGFAPLNASGLTPLGQAVELALQKLEERKQEYKRAGVAYYQPWLVIISDGAPTDSYTAVAQKTHSLSQARKLVALPVGVDGADLGVLGQFSHRGAKKLDGLNFNEFFEWLSASMSRVSASASTSATIHLPATDGWESI